MILNASDVFERARKRALQMRTEQTMHAAGLSAHDRSVLREFASDLFCTDREWEEKRKAEHKALVDFVEGSIQKENGKNVVYVDSVMGSALINLAVRDIAKERAEKVTVKFYFGIPVREEAFYFPVEISPDMDDKTILNLNIVRKEDEAFKDWLQTPNGKRWELKQNNMSALNPK